MRVNYKRIKVRDFILVEVNVYTINIIIEFLSIYFLDYYYIMILEIHVK